MVKPAHEAKKELNVCFNSSSERFRGQNVRLVRWVAGSVTEKATSVPAVQFSDLASSGPMKLAQRGPPRTVGAHAGRLRRRTDAAGQSKPESRPGRGLGVR